jgi:hypothetical protein
VSLFAERHAPFFLQAAAKRGGDGERLARALELANGGASTDAQLETARGWALLKRCGADFHRVLESQLDPTSFMIQVA